MTLSVPDLLKWLEGFGLAVDELKTNLSAISSKFPDGKIPEAVLAEEINKFLTPAVQQAVMDDVRKNLVVLFQTGRSTIKPDPSAMA